MKIALLGATGGTGRLVLTRVRARGHLVTALVRDPERLEGLTAAPTGVARGDGTDAGPVTEAVAGQDAIAVAVSSRGTKTSATPKAVVTLPHDEALNQARDRLVADEPIPLPQPIGDTDGLVLPSNTTDSRLIGRARGGDPARSVTYQPQDGRVADVVAPSDRSTLTHEIDGRAYARSEIDDRSLNDRGPAS